MYVNASLHLYTIEKCDIFHTIGGINAQINAPIMSPSVSDEARQSKTLTPQIANVSYYANRQKHTNNSK
jgi:hypothetical protein